MTNIIKLDSAKYSDIPKMLRALADQVEAGDYGNVPAGVIVLEKQNQGIEVFGLGAGESHRAVSLLTGGCQIMVQRTMGKLITDVD